MARDHHFQAYRSNQIFNLKRKFPHADEQTIERFVENIINTRAKDPVVDYVHTVREGEFERRQGSLHSLTRDLILNERTISPSGAAFYNTEQKEAVQNQMFVSFGKQRKVFKKVMLDARAQNDVVKERLFNNKQYSVKVLNNSGIGATGSAFNLFFDLPSFNAVTSIARMLIAQSYTTSEQLLSGNFHWFSDESYINYVVTHLQDMPNVKDIRRCINLYDLYVPSAQDLKGHAFGNMQKYRNIKELSQKVVCLIDSLNEHERTYIFYANNLHAVLWHNKEHFLPWTKQTAEIVYMEQDEGKAAGDMFKCHEHVFPIVLIAHSHLIPTDDENIEGPRDLIKHRPALAARIANSGARTEHRMNELDPLFDTFMYTKTGIANINKKKDTVRENVVFSDTDSVAFTTKEYLKWYTDTYFCDEKEAFQITSLCVYWLTMVNAWTLRKFSIDIGAREEHYETMQMKNEYTYIRLLMFLIKKTYAGPISINEGRILAEPKLDMKGQPIRGSNIPKLTAECFKIWLEQEVLLASQSGPLNTENLISYVLDHEEKVATSLKEGKTSFLSFKSADAEKNNAASAGALFWNACLSDKYGEIHLPTRVALVPIKQKLCAADLAHLKRDHRKFYNKMSEFILAKKIPKSLAINPELEEIPEILRSLIDVRSTVLDNMKPFYRTLNALGIRHDFETKDVLLSDMYCRAA